MITARRYVSVWWIFIFETQRTAHCPFVVRLWLSYNIPQWIYQQLRAATLARTQVFHTPPASSSFPTVCVCLQTRSIPPAPHRTSSHCEGLPLSSRESRREHKQEYIQTCRSKNGDNIEFILHQRRVVFFALAAKLSPQGSWMFLIVKCAHNGSVGKFVWI